MAENQAMPANAGVVPHHNRTSWVDKGHLHDLAVAPEHEAGIRELKAADKHLFVDLAALADLQIGSVQEGRRSDLNVGSDPDVLATDNRQKSDRRMIAYLNTISADHGSQSDGDSLADTIPF